MAGEGRVVEGNLRVEALETLADQPVERGLVDDRERVDLDEVGVVGEHRPDEAGRDRDGVLEMGAEPESERHLARLEGLQPDQRIGVDRDDRVGPAGRNLLDLDPALGRAHQEDSPGGPIEDGRQVELLDDVGRRPDEDLADRDALDLEVEDRLGDELGLLGEAGELDAARLAPPADQDLGLDHDLLCAGREEPIGGGPGLGRGVGHLPRRDGQTLGDEERLGVGFLDLHGWSFTIGRGSCAGRDRARGGAGCGVRWYRAGDPRDDFGTVAPSRLAILGERDHIGRAAAEGRHAAGTRGTSEARRS